MGGGSSFIRSTLSTIPSTARLDRSAMLFTGMTRASTEQHALPYQSQRRSTLAEIVRVMRLTLNSLWQKLKSFNSTPQPPLPPQGQSPSIFPTVEPSWPASLISSALRLPSQIAGFVQAFPRTRLTTQPSTMPKTNCLAVLARPTSRARHSAAQRLFKVSLFRFVRANGSTLTFTTPALPLPSAMSARCCTSHHETPRTVCGILKGASKTASPGRIQETIPQDIERPQEKARKA